MKLILENVRCFAGRHEIPIRPLTLLVGENSTGKTTLLAAATMLLGRFNFPFGVRFNEPPFSLGSFDTIATYKGGRSGRSMTFSLGWMDEAGSVTAVFGAKDGQPSVGSVHIRLAPPVVGAPVEVHLDIDAAKATVQHAGGEHQVDLTEWRSRDLWYIPFALEAALASVDTTAPEASTPRRPRGFPPRLALREIFRSTRMVRPIAPVRTRPRRTYDEFIEDFSPEGEHIPLVLLARKEDREFVAALKQFGHESGLFREITVKELGRRPGDPVQLMVRIAGPPANLVDVGYGVSQALPVVVEVLRAQSATTFLVQQPEVHLHPRAQAALGSFLVQATQSLKHQFIVETHSDFIVDRVRLEISQGRIEPDKVALLWFDKRGAETRVHDIQLDRLGNIVDPPDGYREFFLQEEFALLTRAGAV